MYVFLQENIFILTQGNTDFMSLVRGSLLSPWEWTPRDRTTVHPADTPAASPPRQPRPASQELLLPGRQPSSLDCARLGGK